MTNDAFNAFQNSGNSNPQGEKVFNLPDLTKVESKVFRAEPGWYNATCVGMDQKTSNRNGETRLELMFKYDIDTPEGTIKNRIFYCPMIPTMVWKLEKVVTSMGFPKETRQLTNSAVKGKTCRVQIEDDNNPSYSRICNIGKIDPQGQPDDNVPF